MHRAPQVRAGGGGGKSPGATATRKRGGGGRSGQGSVQMQRGLGSEEAGRTPRIQDSEGRATVALGSAVPRGDPDPRPVSRPGGGSGCGSALRPACSSTRSGSQRASSAHVRRGRGRGAALAPPPSPRGWAFPLRWKYPARGPVLNARADRTRGSTAWVPLSTLLGRVGLPVPRHALKM